MLDVRNPIGYLFLVLGAMIAVWGYTHPLHAEYITSSGVLPFNPDAPWGIIMFLFGLVMISLARLDRIVKMEEEASNEASPDAANEPKNGKI